MDQRRYEQMLDFVHLPAFAGFLLDHLDDYTKELVRLVYEVDLPLLKNLQHLSEEEKFHFSKKLNFEFLTNISQNNARGHLESITNRWFSGQFENIGKYDVEAQDVTLINWIRSRAQKKFINQYTSNPEVAYGLHSEIDSLSFVYNNRSINDYLKVLKDKIGEEAHFSQNIIEASPGITFIYDLENDKEIYINGRVEEVTGFTPGEVVGETDFIRKIIHPKDIPVVMEFIRLVIEENEMKTRQAEYRIINKKGTFQWMRCYAVVYKRNSSNKPVQILGTAFDINTEIETAFALRNREKQLLEAQSIGKIGSFEWDIGMDTSVITPEVKKIFESDQQQDLQKLLAHVHPGDIEKLKLALAESFITGSYQCEYRYMADSGEKMIDSRGLILYDEANQPIKLTGTIQDITQRKKIEETLIKKTLELERSNTQLQEFASVASHDLKEPLRKIALFSNIIMTSDWDELPEATKMNIQKISESSIRMQKLIEGILSYSAINANLEKEKISLEQLLQDAISNLEYKIRETGASISSDGLPTAEVIPFQIQQLFQNLVGNALKFSKKRVAPQVKISHEFLPASAIHRTKIKPAARYLQIQIADNGIGFDSSSSEKIFGLFQRLHGRSDYEGSGLGLAICKRIVENHNGIITAHSEPDEGSRFTILLPISS